MINTLKQHYQVDIIIIEEFDGSIKFYNYYSDDDWMVAIANKDTIEIYNFEGIMINQI